MNVPFTVHWKASKDPFVQQKLSLSSFQVEGFQTFLSPVKENVKATGEVQKKN